MGLCINISIEIIFIVIPLMNCQSFTGRYCERQDERVKRPDVAFTLVKLAYWLSEHIHQRIDPQPGF